MARPLVERVELEVQKAHIPNIFGSLGVIQEEEQAAQDLDMEQVV